MGNHDHKCLYSSGTVLDIFTITRKDKKQDSIGELAPNCYNSTYCCNPNKNLSLCFQLLFNKQILPDLYKLADCFLIFPDNFHHLVVIRVHFEDVVLKALQLYNKYYQRKEERPSYNI